MRLYELEPEVAGGIGENTVFINPNEAKQKNEREIVSHLHYEFYGWLGDEILETTPCFIVTASLADDIRNSDLTGYIFDDVEISKSDEFIDLYPKKILPKFKRLIPQGTVDVYGESYTNWSGHDFCFSQKSILVVTEKVLSILKHHSFENCDIKELNSRLNDELV